MGIGVELLALAVVAALAAWLLVGRSTVRRVTAVLVACVLGGLIAPRIWPHRPPALATQQAAQKTDDLGYVSSTKCRACHPSQFESWHRSFHRKMTQVASRATIIAPYEHTVVQGRGRQLELDVRDGELWAKDIHPEALYQLVNEDVFRRLYPGVDPRRVQPQSLRKIEGPITMTTGSHHMQIYWIRDELGIFRQLNWVWLAQDRRWVPTEDVYNQPHSGSLGILGAGGNWAIACSPCHATAPEVRYPRPGRPQADTRVGELGIACEACHGPAEKHVAANHNPIHRYRRYIGGDADPTIVNPAQIDHVRSTQICGQCHAIMKRFPKDVDLEKGSPYRPGLDLNSFREVVNLEPEQSQEDKVYYWPDGASRSTGREYNAVIQSGCYTKGEMDCVSCHSMHESDPDDQLAAGKQADGACIQCHSGYARNEQIEAHTHHAAASTGSRCMNCHMTNTTYGLLKMTRIHRVDSPVVAGVDGGERPNACNLCHLDRTLAWTQQQMAAWYKTASRPLSEDETMIPAGVLWLVRGDSMQRAAVAWHLGWKDALAALPPGWGAPWLARSLDDPYAAVRYLAGKSLKRMPGYENLETDYVLPETDQQAVVETAKRMAGSGVDAAVEAGRDKLFTRLRSTRNNQPILLPE